MPQQSYDKTNQTGDQISSEGNTNLNNILIDGKHPVVSVIMCDPFKRNKVWKNYKTLLCAKGCHIIVWSKHHAQKFALVWKSTSQLSEMT